jgi:hypothetical protein
MISAHLIELIEIHAERLTSDVVKSLMTNPRTTGFRSVRLDDLERRVFQILHELGVWLDDPKAERVHAEFVEWGRRRFEQGIHLGEVVYAVLLFKGALRRYIRDNGLAEAAVPHGIGEDVLPVRLHGLMDLVDHISSFFDEAIYHLCCGYEEARRADLAATSEHRQLR